ncbi:MAG: DUF4838 domain-containing protein, partial [Clostridia bacterium]|nr:DUF4838 domain-containing protein [Clostridia bacterium]
MFANGVTQYTIVYPEAEANNGSVMNAVKEIRALVQEATGVVLSTKSDAQVTSKDKIISISATAQALNEPAVDEAFKKYDLKQQGYIIETVGTSVYIRGISAIANLYGAYEFLHWQFGYEYFYDDCYALNKNVRNLNLKEFHLVDVPDFQIRTGSNYMGSDRARLTGETVGFNYVENNSWCHNWLELLDSAKYGTNAEWYAGTQLCLNAGGDAESRERMIDAVAYEMTWRLEEDVTKDWMAFSFEDGGEWCGCAACTRDNKLYDTGINTNAYATQIRFTNEVAKKVKEWNVQWNKDHPENQREIIIWIYRYGKAKDAPVKLDENKKPYRDENGNFIPYSEDLIMEDNIGVVYCGNPSASCYSGDVLMQEYVDSLDRTVACMKVPRVYFWYYSANFRDYLAPHYPYYDTRQDHYQYAVSRGGVAMLDMGRYSAGKTGDWTALTQYITQEMLWDCQQDVSEMIERFFANYFQDAADVMMEMFQDQRAFMWNLAKTKNTLTPSASLYPYQTIQHYLGYIERAYESIEALKITNKELYQTLSIRIKRESIPWRWLELKFYPSYFSYELLKETQQQFLFDCREVGISQSYEHSDIGGLFG